ncbi:uncharacterized protein BDR25DRAFT_353487 [Lindgomyces ingoldianus]|uniref:Uncharacterized protein n=1 Tax=Lindgomyces ingoldianus TaxID=673940 RepID=A0ACB6QZY5_9PLEO|nr:uncharacterized protein BDR25DRAFT_353487 [Lindgomyces ingoldianus]KAF2472466.1 hypothetical protein BDR25DRAFT_353487 [Lindgomyces ingoldianus]
MIGMRLHMPFPKNRWHDLYTNFAFSITTIFCIRLLEVEYSSGSTDQPACLMFMECDSTVIAKIMPPPKSKLNFRRQYSSIPAKALKTVFKKDNIRYNALRNADSYPPYLEDLAKYPLACGTLDSGLKMMRGGQLKDDTLKGMKGHLERDLGLCIEVGSTANRISTQPRLPDYLSARSELNDIGLVLRWKNSDITAFVKGGIVPREFEGYTLDPLSSALKKLQESMNVGVIPSRISLDNFVIQTSATIPIRVSDFQNPIFIPSYLGTPDVRERAKIDKRIRIHNSFEIGTYLERLRRYRVSFGKRQIGGGKAGEISLQHRPVKIFFGAFLLTAKFYQLLIQAWDAALLTQMSSKRLLEGFPSHMIKLFYNVFKDFELGKFPRMNKGSRKEYGWP